VSEKVCKRCDRPVIGAAQKRFCSKECRSLEYRVPIRQLRAGEVVPTGNPARYLSGHGYVRLRWRLGKEYVEVYEHRVHDGRVTGAEQVHHINRNRSDNSPQNLARMTETEHKIAHRPEWWITAAELYLAGQSMKQVGNRLGRDSGTVYRGLKRMGIATRSEKRIAIPNREK
jgi:hypothetical protein